MRLSYGAGVGGSHQSPSVWRRASRWEGRSGRGGVIDLVVYYHTNVQKGFHRGLGMVLGDGNGFSHGTLVLPTRVSVLKLNQSYCQFDSVELV